MAKMQFAQWVRFYMEEKSPPPGAPSDIESGTVEMGLAWVRYHQFPTPITK